MPSSCASGPNHTLARLPGGRRVHVFTGELDRPDATADLTLARPAPFDQQTVTASDARARVEHEPATPCPLFAAQGLTDFEPAVIAGARFDQALVIDAGQKPRTRAARIALDCALLQWPASGASGAPSAASTACRYKARGRRDVLGPFHAAFDLERAHPELD